MSDFYPSDDEYSDDGYSDEEYQDYDLADNSYIDFMFPVIFLIRNSYYAEPYPEPELFYPEPEPNPDDWHTRLQPYNNVEYLYNWYARLPNRRTVNETTIEPDSEPAYGINYNDTVEPDNEPACDSLVEYFYDDGPFESYLNDYNEESYYNIEYEGDWILE